MQALFTDSDSGNDIVAKPQWKRSKKSMGGSAGSGGCLISTVLNDWVKNYAMV